MNDKFTNNMNREDEIIGQKLDRVANQTNISLQFASELEERLRNTHRRKERWLMYSFKQVSPALRWVGLVILLGLVLNWSIKSLIPTPQPATDNTPVNSAIATLTPDIAPNGTATSIVDSGGYDWRGTKLYLAAPLPESPTEANINLLRPDQHATVEEARALALQFGIEGEVYQAPGELADTTDYIITDGKQRLYVRSENYFTYYANYSPWVNLLGGKNISEEQARASIDTFLKSYGFDFQSQIEKAPQMPGTYYVVPLASDGYGIRFDYNLPARLQMIVDDNAQIIFVESSRIDYDSVGTYGIRSAEEAFQQILNSSNSIQNGVLEISHSGGILNESFWTRSYSDNQTITIYGQPISYPSVDVDQPPYLSIDSYRVKGSTEGLETLDSSLIVEATGQFSTESGNPIFNVENWKISDATDYSTTGSLRRKENGQVVLDVGGGKEYSIPNAPEDVPLNTIVSDENPPLWVGGLMTGNDFFWKTIQYFPNGALNQGGGGGGGGTGFYKLNLSGAPVPFPSPTILPSVNMGEGNYTVQEGDTLVMIAQNFGITVDELMQANSLNDPMIFVGQKLVIPGAPSDSQTMEYIVQENDTLASIALNFGIPVDELMQANGITDNTVFLGQKLIIPGTQSSSESVQYIVKEGDTVFAIAEAYGITPEKIIQANDWLSEEHALMPGKMLIIPDPQVDPSPTGQRIEGLRGTLAITIYKKPDGGQRIEYILNPKSVETSLTPMLLEGDNLPDLLSNQARPVDIWGTLDHYDNDGRPVVKVERYEIPYPDLQIQLFQGTQENISLDGQIVTMFTSNDGQKYILLYPNGDLDETTVDPEKPQLILEAMAVPNESLFGYPTLRFFGGGFAIDPMTGTLAEFSVTADQPYVIDELTTPENYTPPSATIENVELVYYIPDPRYTPPDPNADPQYIQPAWRFYGHYSNGDEFEIIVQALKQEYLLPELAPYTPPG